MSVVLTRPYPPSAVAREQVRKAIIAAAVERARYTTGYSADCETAIRNSHEHRCMHDGTTCICSCHDQAGAG